jgi:hypothetical protein
MPPPSSFNGINRIICTHESEREPGMVVIDLLADYEHEPFVIRLKRAGVVTYRRPFAREVTAREWFEKVVERHEEDTLGQ